MLVCGCYKLWVIIIWQFFMAHCHILNALYHYHLINNRVNQSHCHTAPTSLLQTEIKIFPPHNKILWHPSPIPPPYSPTPTPLPTQKILHFQKKERSLGRECKRIINQLFLFHMTHRSFRIEKWASGRVCSMAKLPPCPDSFQFSLGILPPWHELTVTCRKLILFGCWRHTHTEQKST